MEQEELKQLIQTYTKLIEEVNDIKSTYNHLIAELSDLKKQYQTRMDTLFLSQE